MTQLLEKAIREISKLPVTEQDVIAGIILDELLDEKKWDTAFAKSQDKLSKLAEKVRNDVREGKIRKMGFGCEL
ncbi:MAG: hypothetical protein AB7S75_16595 [Desulfococcaceae bacterium]